MPARVIRFTKSRVVIVTLKYWGDQPMRIVSTVPAESLYEAGPDDQPTPEQRAVLWRSRKFIRK